MRRVEEEGGDVEEALNGVGRAAVDGEVAEFGLAGDVEDLLRGEVEVDALEVDAGRHDVARGHFVEAEDAVDHGALVLVEDALLGTDLDGGEEFVVRKGAALGPEVALDPAGEELKAEAEGREEARADEEGRRDAQGEGLRMGDGRALGGDLAEDEEEEGHDGDGDEGAVAAEERKRVDDAVADRRDDDVDERVADEEGGEQVRGLLEECHDAAAAGVASGQGLELLRAEREKGRFRSGEEGRGGEEQDEQENLECQDQVRAHGVSSLSTCSLVITPVPGRLTSMLRIIQRSLIFPTLATHIQRTRSPCSLICSACRRKPRLRSTQRRMAAQPGIGSGGRTRTMSQSAPRNSSAPASSASFHQR